MDVETVWKGVKSIPYKRLKFVTIRDPSQKLTLSKTRTYLRRFSEKMWLVSSPKGGLHFHALIVLKQKSRISFKKGIHIKIDDVGTKRKSIATNWREFREELVQDAEELAILTDQMTGDHTLANAVYDKVLAPPSLKRQRATRSRAADMKYAHISNIVSYLNKNINEHNTPRAYIDYVGAK